MPVKKKAAPPIIKRRQKRLLGIFIDGVGLDRATRRINQKVDMSALVRSLSAGAELLVCRYYTVIPHEDDSRQVAFLDAVARSGLTVIVKRLPPVGITRQVTADTEMSADIVAFAAGSLKFPEEYIYRPAELPSQRGGRVSSSSLALPLRPKLEEAQPKELVDTPDAKRIIITVCPTHELSYPISLANGLGVDTVTADFANRRSRNVMGSAAKWIDLSTSESIWRS